MIDVYKEMKRFDCQEDYINCLEEIRFKEQPYCPHCCSLEVARKRENEIVGRWNCYTCGSSFSVVSGTLFQWSRYPLEIWFNAINLMLRSKNSLSSNQMADLLDISQRGAYRMQMKIREEFLKEESETRLNGILEADETYLNIKIGKRRKRGRGANKLKILGVVERDGQVVVRVVDDVKGETINNFIEESIKPEGSLLITDNFKSYSEVHKIVDHEVITRKGKVFTNGIHTNTIEGFWYQLKKSLYGTHNHYSESKASLYLAEICYKYNHRGYSKEKVFYSFLCHSLRAYELMPRWDILPTNSSKT